MLRNNKKKKKEKKRKVPPKNRLKCFCTVYDYTGKADLSMGYWNPVRNLGVVGYFLEIIKQQLF